jgi:hypothetical protein
MYFSDVGKNKTDPLEFNLKSFNKNHKKILTSFAVI